MENTHHGVYTSRAINLTGTPEQRDFNRTLTEALATEFNNHILQSDLDNKYSPATHNLHVHFLTEIRTDSLRLHLLSQSDFEAELAKRYSRWDNPDGWAAGCIRQGRAEGWKVGGWYEVFSILDQRASGRAQQKCPKCVGSERLRAARVAMNKLQETDPEDYELVNAWRTVCSDCASVRFMDRYGPT